MVIKTTPKSCLFVILFWDLTKDPLTLLDYREKRTSPRGQTKTISKRGGQKNVNKKNGSFGWFSYQKNPHYEFINLVIS